MGIKEDMNWLKSSENGWGKVFKLIADGGNISFRGLKELYGEEDWWPLNAYLRLLVDRGLVVEEKGALTMTEQGKKVSDTMKPMDGLGPEL
jgi:hypothetical protein